MYVRVHMSTYCHILIHTLIYKYIRACTSIYVYVPIHTSIYYAILSHTIVRCDVPVPIWIHSAWMVQRLLSTACAQRVRAQPAGVLTLSWLMHIVESAHTAEWQR